MIIRVCWFSEKGKELGHRIFDSWQAHVIKYKEETPLKEWVEESFFMRQPLIFIGACGIAIRSIAPYVKDKLSDPPVIVLDEMGRFVIPVLSGHVGGANELAVEIAKRCSGQAVVTTATDVEAVFSVDVFAKNNGLQIMNRDGIVKISSKILKGEKASLWIEPSIKVQRECLSPEIRVLENTAEMPADIIIGEQKEGAILWLKPKNLVVGIGCRKGKTFAELKDFADKKIECYGWDNVKAIASIDLKEKEEGLVALAQYYGVPFITYSAEELQKIEGDFSESDFVKEVTGVSNVCERAALTAAGRKGKILCPKYANDGMTISVVKVEERIVG